VKVPKKIYICRYSEEICSMPPEECSWYRSGKCDCGGKAEKCNAKPYRVTKWAEKGESHE